MDDDISSTPDTAVRVLQSAEKVEEHGRLLAEELDEQPGIQCEIALSDLFESPYDAILRAGKANSRWGNDLTDIYRARLQEILAGTDEATLTTRLEEELRGSEADPFDAEATGEALTMGFDVESAIRESLEGFDSLEFNEDDLAASLEFAADRQEITEYQAYGTVVVRSTSPISELERRNRPMSRLPQIVQSLLIMGLNVRLLVPRGQPDERDVIEDVFKQIGSMSIEESSPVSMQIDDQTKQVIDTWYGKLNYGVEHGRVPERVVRPASVTAYDLPPEPELNHFVNAVTIGLQGKYSEKRFDKAWFKELWHDRVTPHENYYQYRSERKSFPKVTVAREDGMKQQFELHHEGPNSQPRLNGTPIQTDNPEKELIDLILRFLDAEVAEEDNWNQILELTESKLASDLPIDSVRVAKDALLRANRIRGDATPRLPPERKAGTRVDIDNDDFEWYREHWTTILSGAEITNGTGVGVMAAKKELCRSLDSEDPADRGLFYKLQRDIDRAWSHFAESVEQEILHSLPDELDATIEVRENADRTIIDVTVRPPDSGPVETTIIVHVPYSNVRIDSEPIQRATVSNTVSEVLETFKGILYSRPELSDGFDEQSFLYQLIRLYCAAVGVGEGDLVYFDEIIEFCLSLPGVWECFQRPNRTVEQSLRAGLGDPWLIDRLRENGVTFHRKGSDRHGTIKVNGNQYIAMELGGTEL